MLFDSYFLRALNIRFRNNSSLPFNTLRKIPAAPSPFLPLSLVRFHQLTPCRHTYASPLFHHCLAGADRTSIQARIRQPLASLHKLRVPGGGEGRSRNAACAATRQRTSPAEVGDPPANDGVSKQMKMDLRLRHLPDPNAEKSVSMFWTCVRIPAFGLGGRELTIMFNPSHR